MRLPPQRLGDVVMYGARIWPDATVLCLTSASTGVPALRELDIAALPTLVSVRYDVVPGLAPNGLPLPPEAEQTARALPAGSFGIVMVDPFHTPESSAHGLTAALAAAGPGSILLCHDCLPPADLRSPDYHPDAWSGVTHQAFVDTVIDGDRDWCTIDADFGIGVLGPAGSRSEPGEAEADLHRRWREAGSAEARAALFDAHGPALVRAVTPEAGLALLDRWIDLAAGPSGAADRALRRRIARLEHDLDSTTQRWAEASRALDEVTAAHRAALVQAAAAEAAHAAAQTDLAAARDRVAALSDALAALRASPTFLLGRGLTAPVRALRRFDGRNRAATRRE